jgi:hypothetical protein
LQQCFLQSISIGGFGIHVGWSLIQGGPIYVGMSTIMNLGNDPSNGLVSCSYTISITFPWHH